MSKGKKTTQDTDNEEFDKLASELINSTVPINWNVPAVQSPKLGLHAGKAAKRVRQVRFLQALSEVGVISHAAKVAGINQVTEANWRKSGDAWYEQHFKDALQRYRDTVEVEVHNRAINGVEVPIIGRVQKQIATDVDGNPIFAAEDAVIATKVVKSDLLLMFHAKKHIPEYRDKYEAPKEEAADAKGAQARITVRLEMIAARNQQSPQVESGDVVEIAASDVKQIPETSEA